MTPLIDQKMIEETRSLLEEARRREQPFGFIEDLQVQTIRQTTILRRDLRPVIADLGTHVARAVDAGGGLVTEDNVANRIEYVLTIAGLGTFAERMFSPLFRRHWEAVAIRTSMLINKVFGLRVNPTDVARRVLLTGGRRAGLLDLRSDTKEALLRIIDQAREEGVGVKKLGRQVIADHVGSGRFVNAGPEYRGQLIARTETLHAQRIATIETCKSSDRVDQVLAFDGDEDEDCAARNGNYFPLDEAELESDLEHPNGTLAWGPIVKEQL